MHPGAAVMGLHDERIAGWEGVPQSMECTEFLDFNEAAQKRVWLVSGFAHPGAAAAMLPGMGTDHDELMQSYASASCVIAMLHDHTSGRVRQRDAGRLRIDYTLDRSDQAQLGLGLRKAGELLLAAGARQVVIPLGQPVVCTSPDQLEAITPAAVRRSPPALTAVHPMSTLPMGADPRTSVCNGSGRVHAMNNLWVADGSLYPTSIGGPPQLGIYTLAYRVARGIAETFA
jgi:choline dehydrogenase-like flavoprotein